MNSPLRDSCKRTAFLISWLYDIAFGLRSMQDFYVRNGFPWLERKSGHVWCTSLVATH